MWPACLPNRQFERLMKYTDNSLQLKEVGSVLESELVRDQMENKLSILAAESLNTKLVDA